MTGGEATSVPQPAEPPQKMPQPHRRDDSDTAVSEEERAFLRHILQHAGVDLAHYRLAPLRRRIPACLRGLRVKTLDEARAVLDGKPHLLPAAASSLLIGVTEFFRDEPVFQALREQVVPDLVRRTAGPRVWSVGCSDGAELYSMAILLDEHGALERSHLLGSDCRVEAVERAKRGRFDAAALRSIPDALRDRYLQPDRRWIEIAEHIRRQVHWHVADAVASSPPDAWDLILCRNVAIYLQPAAAARLWQTLTDALAPGGILVVGKAERPNRGGLERLGPCMYAKRSQRC